ncbi:hypothetical protein [Alloalcanivorax profundimaris]|uniref:hypothetical protein n=1 Tax=Alloalcanivorax profundimaris TaxID=2735259 RepID=UPI001370BC43|nr:hypothetical protein [Alloalcanivorax profundimaris]MBM1144868.1 hypothetical protein [Alcanivorax sp. ZXX171]MCQ6261925.1 hypothetical protein [Alcanivorax sp. MM125-6]QJX01523.1 hypothetical protein HML84_01175 [Alcanivorax sp. IO_7]UWN51897.1 hypothetical protein ASALC70_04132 [Alcanivorax sp. ALC70]|tara:strand:- start:7004 stop:7159 length:156 start_codon:yes stop_codon:yes gene_type:complete
MNRPEPQRAGGRPTEPLPKSFKPALTLLGVLFLVTAGIAVAAAVVDRLIYG